jgi:hypothetical protein
LIGGFRLDKITICVGFPIISKLVRGNSVELSNCVLIPDDQLFNESKDDSWCIRFNAKTGDREPAAQSGEAPVQHSQLAIAARAAVEHWYSTGCRYRFGEAMANLKIALQQQA